MTPSVPPPGQGTPPAVPVDVVEDERIAPHGSVHVWWFVEKADDYVKAGEWPGATSERREAGPGTVWERVIRLLLPLGTALMRVEVRPRELVRQDPLSYLEREVKRAPTTTVRSYYRVARGGRLHRVNPKPP